MANGRRTSRQMQAATDSVAVAAPSLADAKTKGIPVVAYGQLFNDILSFLIIGLVVFLIIAIAQFVVITKGAERVAEVELKPDPGIDIQGGPGVAHVTKPGLGLEVGALADHLESVAEQSHCGFLPRGEQVGGNEGGVLHLGWRVGVDRLLPLADEALHRLAGLALGALAEVLEDLLQAIDVALGLLQVFLEPLP